MSGPGAQEEEHFQTAAVISAGTRGWHPLWGLKADGTIGRGFGRKR